MTKAVKKFKETICFSREKEENWEIESKAERKKFKDPEGLVYLGYDVSMVVEVSEDLKHKVLSIEGIDVSDKDIYI